MNRDFNFAPLNDSLPPQNIEAEEAILGGILLDPEAMSRIADLLIPEAFYVNAHQEIYKAALLLHNQGKPTDLMSVMTWLNDNNLLEKVGDQSKLAQLVDTVVSTVNIDRYALLVIDKYQRRKLIQAGHEIVRLGYETSLELETVFDRAEQNIFGLSQTSAQSGLVPISDTLIETFQDIENRNDGTTLPGIPSNFYDLDASTGGFQRSDLIIIAGRPSMGKCLCPEAEILLSDGEITTIEEIYRHRIAELLTLGDDWQFHLTQPSGFVDDGIKPVFRVTTRLGKFIDTTITHPFLTIQGWRQLGDIKPGNRIAVPRKLEIFGTETLPESQVKLLGYLIGDGCLTRSSPQFINNNPLLQAEFAEAVGSFPGLKIRWETSQDTRTPTLYVTRDIDFIRTNRQIFAQRLRVAIKSQSISGIQLAKTLAVSSSLVDYWRKGYSVPNQETFDRLCNCLQLKPKELVPYELAAISKNSKNSLTLWLDKLGLWGKDARHKIIPSIVFKLTRSQISLFLNRLFATDGWATVLKTGQSQIGYGTVSEKLARQIQHLLLRFGIIATLKQRFVKYQNTRRQAWQLDITDAQSLKIFISEIGIFGKEEAIFRVKESLANKKYKTNRDLIPVEIWEELARLKGNEPWHNLARRAGIKGCSNIHVGKRALPRERLFQLATALDNLPLQQLATSEVYWDEIVSIEAVGDKQVYDLTIPETHNFVANDICVHNTSFAMGIARNIAEELPVAIFSLEMSKEQLVQRMLASEANIESNYLRSGRITQNQWEPLSRALGTLSELPIFIDDSPNQTVMQMRSHLHHGLIRA
ncbi:MAG TPA: replicative DNA helicase, partial [Cyanobacteria bacterium UBA11159]|nr:replicative DNA helicase [Cyanobacteria bacterium UBA11159]